jgi:hypothetical protein
VSTFKIQITKSRGHVPTSFKQRAIEWLRVVHACTGVLAFEKGKRNKQLHIQGVVRLQFPDDKAHCDWLRKQIYEFFPARPCDGYKVAVNPLSLGQTFELMVGYCQKDHGESHYELIVVGLSERDCAIFRSMYGERSETYYGDRDGLYKKTLFDVIYTWYTSFLHPLPPQRGPGAPLHGVLRPLLPV